MLGFSKQIVGISHECDCPSELMDLPRVTSSRIDTDGTCDQIDQQVRRYGETEASLYQLHDELVRDLRPDFIITQSLCGVCAVSQREVAALASSLQCRLFSLQARTFQQVIDDADSLGVFVGEDQVNWDLFNQLQTRILRVRERDRGASGRRPRITLLEWTDPLFCSGHWTPELIQWAGGHDPIGKTGMPSRTIGFSELQQADPDVLLVACCGMSLERTRAEWHTISQSERFQKLRCVQNGQVHCFDGSAHFNRPGPRLVDTLERVASLVDQWRQTHD